MFRYSSIYKIYCPYEDGGLRDGFIEEEVDDIISVELNKEITVNDYKNLNACLVDDVIYIRDDGRKAKRVFNLINHYYRVVIEEVSYDIIMDNNYIKEVPIETPEDESLYNMSLWRMFESIPKEMVKQYRIDMTSTDDVLDKIIDKGMDYLDDIDKEILDKNKPS